MVYKQNIQWSLVVEVLEVAVQLVSGND